MTTRTGFVYRWTNVLNGKWYIGSHCGSVNDGYVGSGVLFKQSVEKYGIENFTREILYEGENFRAEEQRILTELNAAKCSKSYNLINTSSDNLNGICVSGDNHHMKRPEIAKKVSDAKKGKFNSNGHLGLKHTEETKERMKESRRDLNYTHSNETKEKMRGIPKTAEHKDKLSKAMKGKPWSEARRNAHNKRKNT